MICAELHLDEVQMQLQQPVQLQKGGYIAKW